MNTELLKRIKSLGWRAGMMALAAVISFFLANINALELSPVMTTMLGLVLGEISKHLNTRSV